MIGKLNKIGFYGNPYIGLFMKSNSSLTVMPINRPEKFSRVCDILETKEINVNIFGSPLSGLYTVMNDNGILFSNVMLDYEFQTVKQKIKEIGLDLNVDMLDTEFTALSNNMVVNNKHCIINPKMKQKNIIQKIRDNLDVEVSEIHLKKFSVIGSVIFANDNGFVAHPGLAEDELDLIEETLQISGGVATANGGVPFISLCLVGNNKSVIFGETTTAFEQQRIIDALGFM
ncbi:MAG: translation initiation factor IF-6 [Candidatus Micrarchaeota archaeon]|nr:translation initiation factor IF-6 [Candidatus Micrarchaeota archaeon]